MAAYFLFPTTRNHCTPTYGTRLVIRLPQRRLLPTLFCAGHTTLADGRVFIAGGHITDYMGYPHAVIFDPATNGFTSLPDMNTGRWYPTVTTLPNGDVLVVSGDINANTNVDTLPQVFQFATKTWRNLTTAQLSQPLYPNMLVAPNGKVFNAARTARPAT